MKIGLISDTHGFFHPLLPKYFADCDEIWHAGDVGNAAVIAGLQALKKPLRIVYGNIDGPEIRHQFPEDLYFECQGLKVFMTHIGGAPPKYAKGIPAKLAHFQPHIFICGHSHILRVMHDPAKGVLYMNPGAAGNEGFHTMRTLITFHIIDGTPKDLVVIELGKRGALSL